MSRLSSNSPITLDVVHDLATVPADDWNSGVSPNDPFTEHAFLALLEESNSVGRHAGWVPVHLVARQNDKVVGVAPLYLKNHSYGEYIFDWGWAESAHRAQLPYYPKVVCAVPFTPATGRRLLGSDPSIRKALLDGMHSVVEATQSHSLHILFMTEAEHASVYCVNSLLARGAALLEGGPWAGLFHACPSCCRRTARRDERGAVYEA